MKNKSYVVQQNILGQWSFYQGTGNSWSIEYPDAMVYGSKGAAIFDAERLVFRDGRINALHVICDYGTETEETVWQSYFEL